MKYDEMIQKLGKSPARKPRNSNEEHEIQKSCIKWFRLQYPKFTGLLYAVPNGGKRDAITAAVMKSEGVLAGAPDLCLDVPNHHYHGLRIEMKTRKGTQQASQKEFQRNVESMGYKYILCRSFDDFRRMITQYLMNQ